MVSDSDMPSRVTVVTGAASGIGRGLAQSFARDGDRVVLLDVDATQLDHASRELRGEGLDVLAIPTDVADASSVEDAFARVRATHGRIDVLVSNAGIAGNTYVLDMDESEWSRVIGVNLTGTFLVTRAAARHMVDVGGGGKIVCITSYAGRSARMGAAHYCASKAGLDSYVNVLAMELARHRINVNLVSPGFVDHGVREGRGAFADAEYVAAITAGIPWNRTARIDDIYPAVRFLCSPEAEYITGTLISTDGGSSAGRYSLPLSRSEGS